MSWAESFASRYDEWSAGMTEDVPFYVGLAGEAGGPLVELAVGNGRVAIPVARATGLPVIGIDSSPAMLAQARAAAAEAGVELDLREGDMRDLKLDEPVGLIYCPYRALLHVPTPAHRRKPRVHPRRFPPLVAGGRGLMRSPTSVASPLTLPARPAAGERSVRSKVGGPTRGAHLVAHIPP